MREIFFDPKAGAFAVPGRGAIGLSASFDEVNAALGPEVRTERTGARGVIHARVALGERAFDATFTLGSKGIESASFSGLDHGANEHEIEKTRRDRDFLRGLWGPPTYENTRGAMYTYGWGWVYATRGAIAVVAPGHRAPVPSPKPSGTWPSFRCVVCGHLADLGYGSGILEVGRNRGGAPCEACGAVAWVQAGSTTEFYRYSRQPWVCEVGMHPAEGVKLFRLVPPEGLPPAPPGKIRPEALLVKACPAHEGALRRGFLGFLLPADARGEDPA